MKIRNIILFTTLVLIIVYILLFSSIFHKPSNVENTQPDHQYPKHRTVFESIPVDTETNLKETINNLKKNQISILQTLVSSHNPEKLGTFNWYLLQLQKFNKIGNEKFDKLTKRNLVQFAFSDPKTTTPEWFGFFRDFDQSHCTQSSCEIFPSFPSKLFENNRSSISQGIHIDANIQHYHYSDVAFQSYKIEHEQKMIREMNEFLTRSSSEDINSKLDREFALKMWISMRPLNILLNNEAVAPGFIAPHAEEKNTKSTMDLTICWSGECSIRSTYFYSKMKLSMKRDNSHIPEHCVCAFISNCAFSENRLAIVSEISRTVPVRQYGSCGKNAQEGTGGKVVELAQNCKFYLAFENTLLDDYITEKFFESFQPLVLGGKLMSIYRGAKNIDTYGFPKSSFINYNSYSSPTELAVYLKNICSDSNRFLKLIEESLTDENLKTIEDVSFKLHLANVIKSPCKICTAIAEVKLSRYLLFKIGLTVKKDNHRVSRSEFISFLSRMGYDKLLSPPQLTTLMDIFDRAYGRLYRKGNGETNWNDYYLNYLEYIK